METVERWWNGVHGYGRRDVRLLTDGTDWKVEARQGGRDGEQMDFDAGNEAAARRILLHCLGTGGDDWRRLPG